MYLIGLSLLSRHFIWYETLPYFFNRLCRIGFKAALVYFNIKRAHLNISLVSNHLPLIRTQHGILVFLLTLHQFLINFFGPIHSVGVMINLAVPRCEIKAQNREGARKPIENCYTRIK